MKIINVQEAKTHLSRLLEQVSAGDEIIIGKHGRPIAKLTAYAPEKEPRRLDGLEGEVEMSEDFNEEIFEISALFYGESKRTTS